MIENLRMVLAEIDENRFVMPVDDVVEYVPASECRKFPATANYVSGLGVYRNSPLVVLDSCAFVFDVKRPERAGEDQGRWVVLRLSSQNAYCAVEVSRVVGLVEIEESSKGVCADGREFVELDGAEVPVLQMR